MEKILISINKKWADKIIQKDKTIEVRKTKPKLTYPVKVLIYETIGQKDNWVEESGEGKWVKGSGKVIAEFILKEPEEYDQYNHKIKSKLSDKTYEEYSKSKKTYAWEIDKLKHYKEPKELSDYISAVTGKRIERAPQNWMRVKEIINE